MDMYAENLVKELNELLEKASKSDGMSAYSQLLDKLKQFFNTDPPPSPLKSKLMMLTNKIRQATNDAYKDVDNFELAFLQNTIQPETFDLIKTKSHHEHFVQNWAKPIIEPPTPKTPKPEGA